MLKPETYVNLASLMFGIKWQKGTSFTIAILFFTLVIFSYNSEYLIFPLIVLLKVLKKKQNNATERTYFKARKEDSHMVLIVRGSSPVTLN